MSASIIASYTFASKQVNIYIGITIFITGLFGGIFNTIVFLSLQTFRQNSCAFYLTIMSIVNIGQLLTGVLSRIMNNLYESDGSESSLFYCKFRVYIFTVCATISWTCFCLATIDQYCATCSRARFQQWCNIKLAQRLIIIFTIIWILHTIPYLIFANHILSPITHKVTCTVTNVIYGYYRTYVIILLFFSFLPVTVSVLFGSMAYRNIQQLSHHTLPLARRQLDKQLAVMVLTQVFINCFVVLPTGALNSFQLGMNISNNPILQAQIQLASDITIVISYLYFAAPFYIYICVSERFRRQFIYVLFKIHSNCWRRQPRIINNQVIPQA